MIQTGNCSIYRLSIVWTLLVVMTIIYCGGLVLRSITGCLHTCNNNDYIGLDCIWGIIVVIAPIAIAFGLAIPSW